MNYLCIYTIFITECPPYPAIPFTHIIDISYTDVGCPFPVYDCDDGFYRASEYECLRKYKF